MPEMRELSNFGLLYEYAKYDTDVDNDENLFLFGQIISRRKDGGKFASSNNYIVKDLVFHTSEDFENKRPAIKAICQAFNARAYVNLSPRNYRRIAIDMAGICLDYIRNSGERACRSAFATACGRSKPKNRVWIIDVDNDTQLADVIDELDGEHLDIIPTPNGHHVIIEPCDIREFRKKFPDIDIHKNNPTVLYAYIEDRSIEKDKSHG